MEPYIKRAVVIATSLFSVFILVLPLFVGAKSFDYDSESWDLDKIMNSYDDFFVLISSFEWPGVNASVVHAHDKICLDYDCITTWPSATAGGSGSKWLNITLPFGEGMGNIDLVYPNSSYGDNLMVTGIGMFTGKVAAGGIITDNITTSAGDMTFIASDSSTMAFMDDNGTFIAPTDVCSSASCLSDAVAGVNGTDINVTDLFVDGDITTDFNLQVDGTTTLHGDLNISGIVYFDEWVPGFSRSYYQDDAIWYAGGNPIMAFSGPSWISWQPIRPDTTDTIDLGTSSKRWKDFYLGSDLYLNGGLISGPLNISVSEILTNSSDITVPGKICDSGGSNCIGDGGGGSTPTSGHTTFQFRDGKMEIRIS